MSFPRRLSRLQRDCEAGAGIFWYYLDPRPNWQGGDDTNMDRHTAVRDDGFIYKFLIISSVFTFSSHSKTSLTPHGMS
jgi:hypothetical protein